MELGGKAKRAKGMRVMGCSQTRTENAFVNPLIGDMRALQVQWWAQFAAIVWQFVNINHLKG